MSNRPVFKKGDRVRVRESSKKDKFFLSGWKDSMGSADINGIYTVACMTPSLTCVHLVHTPQIQHCYCVQGMDVSYGFYADNYELALPEVTLPENLFEV